MARYRIGIDVGGTFTDFVLVDMAETRLEFHKEPSVPDDPSAAVERGMRALAEGFGISLGDVELVVHGTTIGLNAIIQRRGARMALVVSKGNRDVLELARLRLPSSYDFTAPRESPLVPRDRVFEVGARMRSDGSVAEAPDAAELEALAAELRGARVDAVAVMLLNSYRDGSLERTVSDALRAALPEAQVSESSTIWPEVREYERCLVAALNAYIQPLMSGYFRRLEARVEAQGVAAPIYITANNGGTLSVATARERPIETALSGPASGVVASTRVGSVAGRAQLITFDMGGTSTDISICPAGVPEFTASTEVGDFPLMMPVVNVSAIGAGGGSILWVDAQGLLKVGPVSVGADPGPVCYGRGGTVPAITDCYLVLGIIDAARFLDGRMALDVEAARAALGGIADRLGFTGPHRAREVAAAALRVASAKMAAEITKLLAQAGVDPRRYSLLAYGGAGPTHANLLVREAGVRSVLIPTAPGTFCALGAILADVRRDYVRTAQHLIGPATVLDPAANGWPAIEALLGTLEREAAAWVSREGSLVGAHDFVVSFNLRYPSQAYELTVIVPMELRDGLNGGTVARLFHEEHHRRYGFSDPATPVQTTTIRLGVIGKVAPVDLPAAAAGTPEPSGRRGVWHDGRSIPVDVYPRSGVGAGALVRGPAIIEQADTTTFLLPGWQARADRLGTLCLTEDAEDTEDTGATEAPQPAEVDPA
ncbi:MAG: hydantoinase/oxoprolinase family protein [Immundisolibacterales bacterium]|nr:hydantoinase/oxoprolinase family protein [Immundisolibacterales bacterium]